MRNLKIGLLFGLGLLLGGAACRIDWNNPWGGPQAPSGPCEITGPASECLNCERRECCTAVESCAASFVDDCLDLTVCWQGRSICPVYHDPSSQAVDDCLRMHCADVCPGGNPS